MVLTVTATRKSSTNAPDAGPSLLQQHKEKGGQNYNNGNHASAVDIGDYAALDADDEDDYEEEENDEEEIIEGGDGNEEEPSSSSHQSSHQSSHIATTTSKNQKKKVSNQKKKVSELHFSSIGFPKTGTTFIGNWLNQHPHICMPRNELNGLHMRENERGQHLAILKDTLKDLQRAVNGNGKNSHKDCQKFGYKSPMQVRQHRPMLMLGQHFPQAKLIVGVRHPVSWFKSVFNYKLRRISDALQKHPPEKLRNGNCPRNVCTDNARFHVFLSYLGKTQPLDPKEQQLLSNYGWKKSLWMRKHPNQIFLYEVSQLDFNKQPKEFGALRHDLSNFLGLTSPFPPSKQEQKKNVGPESVFDICEPQYKDLREELVRIGSSAADWILHHFLKSPDVTVSSPAFFRQKLKQWRHDPCVSSSKVVAFNSTK